MLEISTYFHIDNQLIKISDVSWEKPPKYVEGSIELIWKSKVIIRRDLWDDIDDLWCDFVEATATLESEPRFETYYPDQPIKLIFERQGPNVKISIGSVLPKECVIPYELFVEKIKEAGITFFTALNRAQKTCMWDRSISDLKKIGSQKRG